MNLLNSLCCFCLVWRKAVFLEDVSYMYLLTEVKDSCWANNNYNNKGRIGKRTRRSRKFLLYCFFMFWRSKIVKCPVLLSVCFSASPFIVLFSMNGSKCAIQSLVHRGSLILRVLIDWIFMLISVYLQNRYSFFFIFFGNFLYSL